MDSATCATGARWEPTVPSEVVQHKQVDTRGCAQNAKICGGHEVVRVLRVGRLLARGVRDLCHDSEGEPAATSGGPFRRQSRIVAIVSDLLASCNRYRISGGSAPIGKTQS